MSDRGNGGGVGSAPVVPSDGGNDAPSTPRGQQSMSAYVSEGSGSSAAAAQQPPRRPRQAAHVNQEAAKLTFPSGIPEAVRNAILTYKLPPRRAYHPIKEKKNQSVAVWYGVKLDVVGEGGLVDPNQKYWACLADHKCRKKSDSGSMIKLQGKTTTGATQHLSSVHKIDSAAAQQSKKRKADSVDMIDATLNSKAYKDNPSRYNQIQFVKSYVISAACPFNLGENPNVRHQQAVASGGDKDKFAVDSLNKKAIKKIVVELYDDTTKRYNAQLAAAVRRAPIPIVYLNCDIWQSKVSQDKFIGMRIFYMDAKGIPRTHLLAVKLFRPDPSLGKITGGVVLKWLRQVLAQHGLHTKDIAGAVTDAGADVSTGVGSAFSREWCHPHMINRALLEGTGVSTSGGSSTNPECWKLLDEAKKVIQYFNKSTGSKILFEDVLDSMSSGKGSKSKLTQAFFQRWTSACKMLLRLLQKWPALIEVFARKEQSFPLQGKKKEFEEVYSIVRALKDFTVYCQTTHEATAEQGMQKMISLLSLTLEPTQDLVMLRVPSIIVVDGAEQDGAEQDGAEQDGDDDGPAAPTTDSRAHADLTEIGRVTRETVSSAVGKRFLPRYGPGLYKRLHLFDHVLLLSPTMRKLGYVDTLAGSTAGKAVGMRDPVLIKAQIKEEVLDLLAKAVIELRARNTTAVTVEQQDGADNTRKRLKTSNVAAATSQTHKDMKKLGLLDDSDSDDEDVPETEGDARKEAETILKEWLGHRFGKDQKFLSAAEYWRLHGSKHPLALRAVAQAVLGCPASAGVIERDFCLADWFMPRKRGSLDPAYLEMLLFLRAQYDYIRNDVPTLSDEAAKAAIPDRLRDQTKLDEVKVLTFEAQVEEEVEMEKLGPEWEAL